MQSNLHSRSAVLFLALVSFFNLLSTQPRAADLILHNGYVRTPDERNPAAQAVAITGSAIAAVGSDSGVLRLRGPSTQIIDLKEAFVVPGFNDNHVPFEAAAAFLEFNFEEKIKGSITPGKLAGIAVLSKNLLTVEPAEILTTEILYTIVDGKIVYRRQ